MRDMMSVILEGALDEELNEELGYSDMIIVIKIPITVAMVILGKPCIPVMGIWKSLFLVIVMANMNPD